jgi:hypothetical protein
VGTLISFSIHNCISGHQDSGLKVELVFKRRIINAILTTYLPSFLILAIVYTTNFFKPFFFEAVVTVNLTALLVLTTLFISVSGSLPPTAYVKMIDIWLIFSQLIPFTEVLLHTFMDCMRSEVDREVNHHGKAIQIGDRGNKDLNEAWVDEEVADPDQVQVCRSCIKGTHLNMASLSVRNPAGTLYSWIHGQPYGHGQPYVCQRVIVTFF